MVYLFCSINSRNAKEASHRASSISLLLGTWRRCHNLLYFRFMFYGLLLSFFFFWSNVKPKNLLLDIIYYHCYVTQNFLSKSLDFWVWGKTLNGNMLEEQYWIVLENRKVTLPAFKLERSKLKISWNNKD